MLYGDVMPLVAFLLWVGTGAVIGAIFGVIIGTGEPGGLWGFFALGIIGAVVSGLFFRVLQSGYVVSGWQVNVMAAAVGAIVLMTLAEYTHRLHSPPPRHRVSR